MLPENFRKKNVWLFDLDNTLYSPNTGIFSQIDKKMKQYISGKLNLSEEKAFKLQKYYYEKYGTTLYGLMKNYKIDPDEFCDFVHDVDLKNLKKSEELKYKLKLLPGKKIVYTNGDHDYAMKILNSLGINEVFSDIFDIKKSYYFPKPMKKSMNKLIKEYNLKPEKTVYFEDLNKNLKYAYSLGITTVHISNNIHTSNNPYIDLRFKTIINALDMIIKNLNNGKDCEIRT